MKSNVVYFAYPGVWSKATCSTVAPLAIMDEKLMRLRCIPWTRNPARWIKLGE